MQYSLVAAALVGAVAAVPQWGPHSQGGSWSDDGSWGSSSAASDVTVTDVMTAFTTYCPEATSFSHGGSWYSVTAPTTIVISYST